MLLTRIILNWKVSFVRGFLWILWKIKSDQQSTFHLRRSLWWRVRLFYLPFNIWARNLWYIARKGWRGGWHAGSRIWSHRNVSFIFRKFMEKSISDWRWHLIESFYLTLLIPYWLLLFCRSRLGCQILVREDFDGIKVCNRNKWNYNIECPRNFQSIKHGLLTVLSDCRFVSRMMDSKLTV